MKESIKSIAEWSEQTFPDATLRAQLSKFKDEKKEYVASVHITDEGVIVGDINELADMFIVAAGMSRFNSVESMFCLNVVAETLGCSCFSTKELEDAVDYKMGINRKRKWKKQGGKYQHEESLLDDLELLVHTVFK